MTISQNLDKSYNLCDIVNTFNLSHTTEDGKLSISCGSAVSVSFPIETRVYYVTTKNEEHIFRFINQKDAIILYKKDDAYSFYYVGGYFNSSKHKFALYCGDLARYYKIPFDVVMALNGEEEFIKTILSTIPSRYLLIDTRLKLTTKSVVDKKNAVSYQIFKPSISLDEWCAKDLSEKEKIVEDKVLLLHIFSSGRKNTERIVQYILDTSF